MSPSAPLGVVCCHFNPCGYRSRLENYHRFREGLRAAPIHLLTVELAFGEAPFEIEPDGTELVQVRGRSVIWQKERLLNHGLAKLAGDGFEHLCWLDADILFDEPDWAERVLVELETNRLVQVFEIAHRFGEDAPSAASELQLAPPRLCLKDHGMGWAAPSDLLERTRLYESMVVGGGDTLMFLAALGHPRWSSLHDEVETRISLLKERAGPPLARDVERWIDGWAAAVDGRIGCAANRIVAQPHGSRAARRYGVRANVLGDLGFDPVRHLDRSGIALEWADAPNGLERTLVDYFRSRAEDEPADETGGVEPRP